MSAVADQEAANDVEGALRGEHKCPACLLWYPQREVGRVWCLYCRRAYSVSFLQLPEFLKKVRAEAPGRPPF